MPRAAKSITTKSRKSKATNPQTMRETGRAPTDAQAAESNRAGEPLRYGWPPELLDRCRKVFLKDGQVVNVGPDVDGNFKLYIEDGKPARWAWTRDVDVPLKTWDYEIPMIARVYPFRDDSAEEPVSLGLAAALLMVLPHWRRFKLWPIVERDGARGYRAGIDAYAELWTALARYGYEPAIFKSASLPEVEQMLGNGRAREETDRFLAERRQAEATPADDRTGETGTAKGHRQKDAEGLSDEARAVAAYVDDPTQSMTALGKRVGVPRQRLYEMPRLRAAREAHEHSERISRLNAKPGGEKDAETGSIEAWTRDDSEASEQ